MILGGYIRRDEDRVDGQTTPYPRQYKGKIGANMTAVYIYYSNKLVETARLRYSYREPFLTRQSRGVYSDRDALSHGDDSCGM